MTPFKRGLPDAMVDELNDLAQDPKSWWRVVIDDPSVYLAIRNDSLNVYAYGNSLLKVNWSKRGAVCSLHHKFAWLPGTAGRYITLDSDDQEIPLVVKTKSQFSENYARIKKQVSLYKTGERCGVTALAAKVDWIIDMEAALSPRTPNEAEIEPDDDSTKETVDRIDFVAFNTHSRQLAFCEAKLLGNSELVSSGTEPDVSEQLQRYRKQLADPVRMGEALTAYRTVQELYSRLKGLFFERRRATLCQQAIATLDPEPRLIVFGFDNAQKKLRIPNVRMGLKSFISPANLITVGSANSLTLRHVFKT